ncbi:MAG: hypothetical protein KU37_04320 [Sulfuricurvum sp. PC08-66]|nr:MAG: hypothetical protein KU37_04320 [Sulfuricurvum sp. PC08-66]
MKKILTIALAMSIALLFVGCDKMHFEGGSTQVSVATCESYTQIQSGDTLVKEASGTVVKIIDLDGNRSVCVVSGSATLYR